MSMNVLQLADRLRTEADAYLYLEELRWGDHPVCPHCGSVGEHYFLTPANGRSRRTRTGAASERRVWKCSEKECRNQFSVLTGTIFHRAKIPVRIWCFLVFEMAARKNGISAREVERKYGLCPRSAWFALHRLREAMKRGSAEDLFSGRVIADETCYGGKPSNRHNHKAKDRLQGQTDKTPILALVSRESGEVCSRAIPNVRRETLREAIAEHVDMPETLPAHRRIAELRPARERVREPRRRQPQGPGVRPRRCDDQPRGDLLLAAKALTRRNTPPRQPRAPRCSS